MTEPTGPQFPPAGPPPALPSYPPQAGYSVPPQPYAQPGYDPLISPDFSGWFQRGMAIVRRGWRPLATVQGIGAIVSFLVQAPVVVYAAFAMDKINKDLADSTASGSFDFKSLLAMSGYTALSSLIAAIIMAIVTIAATHISVSVAVGAPPTTGAAVSCALRRALPLVGWEVLGGFLVLLGTCLCVVPGIYVYAVLVILPAVVVFERGGALARCFRLFHTDFPAAAGRIGTIIGLGIAASGVGTVLGMLVNAVAGATMPNDTGLVAGSLISAALTAVAQAIVGVLSAPLILAAYADLRARFEPLSTTVLAQQLGLIPQPPAAPMPPPATPAPGY